MQACIEVRCFFAALYSLYMISASRSFNWHCHKMLTNIPSLALIILFLTHHYTSSTATGLTVSNSWDINIIHVTQSASPVSSHCNCTKTVEMCEIVCSSLDTALHCLHVIGNSTLLYIHNGNYTLNNESENRIQSHV